MCTLQLSQGCYVHIAVKPRFLCARVQTARRNEPHYALSCAVHARPGVEDTQFWAGVTPNDSIRFGGEQRGEFNPNITTDQVGEQLGAAWKWMCGGVE